MAAFETPSLVRDTLRLQARDLLRARLLRGQFGEGRLNESEIATQIGISRTPLREALRGLEEEGLLYSVANQGFFVKPLSLDEVREIYPVLWELEALALRLAGGVTPAQFERLAALNAQLESAVGDPGEAMALDSEWHVELLKGCQNRRLLEIIHSLKQGAYRYEFSYMQQAKRVAVSASQHRSILAALKDHDMASAIAGLEANWRVTLEATEEWLASRGR